MTRDEQDVVSVVRQGLSERIGRDRYVLWFHERARIACRGSELVVAAGDEFLVDRLRKQFSADLLAVGEAAIGEVPRLRFVVETSAAAIPAASKPVKDPTESGAPAPHRVATDGPRDARPRAKPLRHARLSAFVVGDGNRVAATAARSVVRRLGAISPLFLHGPHGCGKTHLLEGIWSECRGRSRPGRALLLAAEQFTRHFLEALQGSGLPSFRRKVRDVDVLLIDDLQFFAGKRATLVELQHTIDALLREGRQLVLAADRPPAALKGVGPEMIGRVAGGLVCGIEPADFATRLGIARQMAGAARLDVPAGVLERIVGQLEGDARQISGALNRLQATSEALQQPITPELAETALEDIFHATRRFVHLVDIERAVCEVFGLEPRSLREAGKAKVVSQPRMLAMWLARKHTRAPFSEISQYFGRRSHSTVISAEKKVNRWMSSGATIHLGYGDCRVEDAIRRVETQLRAG